MSTDASQAKPRRRSPAAKAANPVPPAEAAAKPSTEAKPNAQADGQLAATPSGEGAEEAVLPKPTEGRGFYEIVIEGVRPSTPSGYPAKGLVGEAVPVRADIFRHGHDILAARALLYCGDQLVATGPLRHQGNDFWTGLVGPPMRVGDHRLVVEAWTDRYATWAHKTAVKLAARQPVAVEIAEGAKLLEEWLRGGGHDQSGRVSQALSALSDAGAEEPARVNAALSSVVAHLLAGPLLAHDLTRAEVALWVDRQRAGVGAWYEIFPRSFGGLRGAADQVPRIAGLGFDVLYMPPIHPIGRSYRKGRNNTLEAGPNDPGSPYAIGAAEGGHLAIHPDLGTFEDFEHLVRTASEHGMELALDYALNCSPEHPWVSEHPEWFHHRPDGSIAYAENPPKKYQDIYPLNMFPERDEDREALWQASKEIFDFWSDRGVRIFRVDNPHTKPFSFWEWCIGELRKEKPDLVFLAEAFTRPKMMARLAEIGFSQSYTYFTWRTGQYGPEGLRTYVDELAQGPTADYMRPNFWPTTPDILSGPLRNGPPAAFALRYVLAATLSPSYGIYGGYELYENEPLSPDNEEFMWSEKYEIRHRDFSRPGSLAPLFSAVNRVRRAHPAFSRLRTTHFHGTDNPNVMVYSKTSELGGDVVLVVVTLDPYATQESTLHLDLPVLGLTPGSSFEVRDELSGDTYTWGEHPYVRLDPYRRVAHIMSLPGSGLE